MLRCPAFLTSTNASIFIVTKLNTTTNNIAVGVWKVQFGSSFIVGNAPLIYVGVNNSITYARDASISAIANTQTHIYGCSLTSSTTPGSAFTFNGSADGTNTTVTGTSTSGNAATCAQQVGIGGLMENGAPVYQIVGNIHEVVIFTSVLTTDQMQQIEGYLAWKWGLQASLPRTHPYFYNPLIPNLVLPSQSLSMTPAFLNPSRFSGLSLWLDAADSASVVTSGSNVTRWNDKSGFGFNMSNNASYQLPTYNTTGFNGNPTISFFRNSSNSFSILENTAFSFNSTPSFTLFFIAQTTSSLTTVYQHFFSAASSIGGADAAGSTSFAATSGPNNAFLIYERSGIELSKSVTTTTPFLGEVIVNGTVSAIDRYAATTNYIYTNGIFKNSSTGGSTGTNFIFTHVRLGSGTTRSPSNDGGSETLQGNTSEVLLFNRTLTTNESQAIEGYLAWKWGLQANLPANHPYVLFPPN